MNLPDVPVEYYLCWSSIIVGVTVPFMMIGIGLARKDRRLFSLGLIAGSIFVFYPAYWFWFLLALDDPDYSMVPAYAWVVLGGILALGIVLVALGVLMLVKKTVVSTKLIDWLQG